MDSLLAAQRDMREAYYNGVPGIIASGTAWIAAGFVAAVVAPLNGILTLVFGGMAIFPVSILISKLMGRSGKHDPKNPLAPLAIEGTFWMLLSIPVAGAAAFYRIEWFFPGMMLVIAGRYLTFSTLYGMKHFWAFSGALVLGAAALVMLEAPTYAGGLTGGGIELLFALVIFVSKKPAQA